MDKMATEKTVTVSLILLLITKYFIQGLVIAIVALYLPSIYKVSIRKPTINEIFAISLTSAISMFILDYFSDNFALGLGARLGAGFTIGKNLAELA